MSGPEAPVAVAPAKPRGLSVRVAAVLAVLLLLAFGAATAWAVVTSGELERTRQALVATEGDLASTSSALDSTKGDLDETSANLASERSKIKANASKVTSLEFQIERKSECIAAQTANLVEFRRILALERENFGRTTTGSTWAKAHAASDRALDLAIDYLAKSYSSAAAGSYNTANSWLSKSNAQIRVSNRHIDVANKENTAINAASDAINAATDALYATLDDTLSTCGR